MESNSSNDNKLYVLRFMNGFAYFGTFSERRRILINNVSVRSCLRYDFLTRFCFKMRAVVLTMKAFLT
mgnify:CR=1 FL=1